MLILLTRVSVIDFIILLMDCFVNWRRKISSCA